MEHIFNSVFNEYFIKLFLAMVFGMIIGTERIIAHKTAGMRTYALVSMGAALFVILADNSVVLYSHLPGYNPSVITAAIVSGIGFLGTGLMIWRDKEHLSGLTSATSLWVSAGIGMSVGYGLYTLGLLATVMTLFVFIVLWFVEQQIRKFPISWGEGEKEPGTDTSV
jgi:putative Mg2+ transporter-C (MgtC) family protein